MTCKDCIHHNVCPCNDNYHHYASSLCEDFIKKENVVVSPVAVGQKVWYIKGGYYNSVNKRPREIEVTEINKKRCGKTLDWGFIANQTRYRFSSIGKSVFLTKEEAEQKLKGGADNGNL